MNNNLEYQNRRFVTEQGMTVATAVIPSTYELNATYERTWQSEMVPHFYRISATSPEHGIYMNSYSKEIKHDIKNIFLKGMMQLTSNHTKNGYEKYIDPLTYLQKEAEREAGSPMKAVAKAKLPSILGNDPQAAQQTLLNDIRNYAIYIGVQPDIISTFCESYLYRYTGKMNGRDLVVLAGMDYEGAELDFTPSALDKLVYGKRNKPFPQNKGADDVLHGTARSYFCMYYAEYESEAIPVFMRFVSSIVPDQGVLQNETNLLNAKMDSMRQELAMNQAILAQKQMQLRQNQIRTSQIIAENSRIMSDGIMDSWNKKMASDRYLSQQRSEAIMGTNTYTTSYGNNVDVSVTADHVYQNQFGDVYGVSGTALDQSTLNDLNWKELNK